MGWSLDTSALPIMNWDAVLVDFENTLADLSRGLKGGVAPEYYGGGPGVAPAVDSQGVPIGKLLAELSRRAVPWAVVASSPVANVLQWFAAQGWEVPGVCVGYGDSTLHRPCPDPLQTALGRLGVSPSPAVLALGDSTTDMEAAHRAGLTAAGFGSLVPLHAAPDLMLGQLSAVFDIDGQHSLIGDRRKGTQGVSLACTLPDHDLFVGGRLRSGWSARGAGGQSGSTDQSDVGLSSDLARGRAGRWPPETLDLAHTLLMHAQKGRPGGARLTWVPDRVPRKGPMERLARRLAGRVAIPCHSLLRHVGESDPQASLSVTERAGAMHGRFAATAALDGETVLVLDDARVTGATLDEAARALRAAGAGRVVTMALGQAACDGETPLATWAPRRQPRQRRVAEPGGQSLFF